jgi:tRNA (cytidine/uridine-2'-O-)-methyltransferase
MSGKVQTLKICLFEPEIAQNAGSIARLCACYGMELHIIEPASFVLDEKHFKRAGMDYIDENKIMLHRTFSDFKNVCKGRIILLDVKAKTKYFELQYLNGDCIVAGKESTGIPDSIFDICDEKVLIPMLPGMRSINIAMSVAICASEAMKQLCWNI